MAIKRLHTVVAVVGIAIAGGLAWWWQNRGPAPTGPGAGTPATASPAAGGGNRPGGPTAGGPGAAGRGPGGPAAVEIGKAQAVRLVDDVQAVGSLRARQSVTLRPEVSGRVARLGFADGQRVRRGQLLLQLDDTLQQAQLKQAQAQASIARTNLQRSRELQGQGFVSQSAVDQNLSALEVAEAQVALAQAQLARLKVLAPFDGIVGIRQVNVGDYLKDGAEIVSIDDLAMMLVDFRLPERYMPRVKVGLEVEVNVDAWPEKPFKGRIDALDSQVDVNGRSLLIRARVENPGAQLKGGMFARPRVVLGVRENAVVIPEEALVPLGAKQFLFKLVDGEGGQKVARRIEAQIGLRQPGRVEIVGGLVAGDSVVTAGQARLRGESTPVRVIDLSQGPRPPGAAGGAPQAASASGGSMAKSSASSPQRAASVASAGAPPAARANGSAP